MYAVIEQDDPRINNPETYTDEKGITHIYIADLNTAFELVDGEWVEKAPF